MSNDLPLPTSPLKRSIIQERPTPQNKIARTTLWSTTVPFCIHINIPIQCAKRGWVILVGSSINQINLSTLTVGVHISALVVATESMRSWPLLPIIGLGRAGRLSLQLCALTSSLLTLGICLSSGRSFIFFMKYSMSRSTRSWPSESVARGTTSFFFSLSSCLILLS